MSKGKDYFSKSLEKGLKILDLFNKNRPALTQSEIARILDLNMTSTYRYINTLVELGYLDKNHKTKEIRPAAPCLRFCVNLMQAADHLKMIQETVDRLHRENNISIDMARVVDGNLIRIYHREAEETFTYSLPDFAKGCLHNTALGKAYLSSLGTKERVETVKRMTLSAKTDNTILDKDELLREIEEAAQKGYATTREEYLPGLLAIGAPLRDPLTGRGLGAVSFDFSTLQHDAAEIKNSYGQMIVEAARELSALLPPEQKRS